MSWVVGAILFLLAVKAIRRAIPMRGTHHGSAGWLKLFQAASKGLFGRKGIIVGDWKGGALLPIRYNGAGHILTIGSTGSSKGIGALIPNALSAEFLFLYDPGGEITSVCIKEWRRKGYAVHVLNPWGLHQYEPWELPSSPFNPLDYIDPQSPTFASDSQVIADCLVHRTGEERDPYWTETSIAWFRAMIMHCKTSEPPERQDLPTIREYVMGDSSDWAKRIVAMKANKADPLIGRQANEWQRMLDLESRAFDGVVGTMAQATAWLEDEVMRRSMGAAGVKDLPRTDGLEGVIRKAGWAPMARFLDLKGYNADGKRLPGAVVSVAPELQYAKSHSAYVRLAVACVLWTLMRGSLSRERVVLQIDEAAVLGNMPMLLQALATIRKYKGWLWLTFQNIGQIKQLYGKSWQTFEGNCGMRQYIAAQDQETAEHVSALCGTSTIETESRDSNGRTSFGLTGRRMLTPEEVREVAENEQIVFIGNLKPIKARIRPYWERPSFFGRFNDNPFHEETPGLPWSWPFQLLAGLSIKTAIYSLTIAGWSLVGIGCYLAFAFIRGMP